MFIMKGKDASYFKGYIFGYFSTGDLAKEGYRNMPDAYKKEVEIKKSGLKMNSVINSIVNETTVDIIAAKSAKEIIASRDEDNCVEGYISVHISDIIDRDYDEFLCFLSNELVGNDLLMDITYNVVCTDETDPNTLILKVSGDASMIVDE